MAQRPEMTYGEEQVAFYTAVGLAVTQWAHVENGIYAIALTAFGTELFETLGPSFYSIENFRSKIAFAQAALKTTPNYQEFEKEWLAICAQVTSLSSSRNKVVHGQVIGYPHAAVGRRYAIVPHSLPEPKFKSSKPKPPSGAFCVKEIDQFARQFSMASNRLMSLYYRLCGHADPYKGHALQEPQHRSLAQIRLQIEEVLQPRA